MARYTFAAAIGFLACTGVHSQQTTTQAIASVYLPNADQFAYGVMGSIVSADANKTALKLACPPGTTLCGQYMYGSTVTYGPTTFIYDDPLRTLTQPDVKSVVQWASHRDCSLDDEGDVAVCTDVVLLNRPTTESIRTTTTVTESGLSFRRTPVTITAGFENLKPSPGSSIGTSVAPSTTQQSDSKSTSGSATAASESTPTTSGSSSDTSVAAAATSTSAETNTNGVIRRYSNVSFGAAIAGLVGWHLIN
ncbi:unnamed protein product [Clonostachys rosea f. rosea IK726]|uniref:Uncharacterized protein n=2 Tax=Bionectria ochroleuca TaxID=29856 RepID=A0A0B7KR35_BIOOC|nr:unnamed protein product [Clonostachys rosea f. rosea IK726]